MIKSGIYKITALHSGEFYIGSSNDIKRRWERHRHYFKINQHQNRLLQRIYNKYGKDNFTYEIVEYVEKEKLEICHFLSWSGPICSASNFSNTFLQFVIAKYFNRLP